MVDYFATRGTAAGIRYPNVLVKMMNFVDKVTDFVVKMTDFVDTMMNFVNKMTDFVVNNDEFLAFKMMKFGSCHAMRSFEGFQRMAWCIFTLNT